MMRLEVVHDFDSLVGVDVVVPSEVEVFQRRAVPIARVHGEDEPSVVAEVGVCHHVADAALAIIIRAHGF